MRLLMAGLALLAALPAWAEPIETQKIITGLTGDFNGDDAPDLALIVQTEPADPMDMYFFLRDKEHNYLKQVLVVREQIVGEWNGYDRPGYENSDTEPTLTALANGSIELNIPALPVGGERTDKTLTLTYREGVFLVSGFAYVSENFQVENSRESCEYNVLTGKGTRTKTTSDGTSKTHAVSVAGRRAPFSDWDIGTAFDACGT